jgi:uncharacterized protein YciI
VIFLIGAKIHSDVFKVHYSCLNLNIINVRFFIAIVFICLNSSLVAQDKQYSFVFLNINPEAEKLSKELSDKVMEGHMANINKLAKEGRLLAAGPFEGGGGMFILNTGSVEEVNTWLSADSGIQAKRWNLEIFPYQPVIGSLCPVSAPYDMVMYSFVRFDALVTKFTASTYPKILQAHEGYIKELAKTGNIVTAGVFGNHEGGVLIMRGEVKPEVFENDPGVQQGLLDIKIKQLYIAKGTFCEK